jgi:hypothetical protein
MNIVNTMIRRACMPFRETYTLTLYYQSTIAKSDQPTIGSFQ